MYRIVPSLSGGMNSAPSFVKIGSVSATAATARTSVSQRTWSAPERIGRYRAINTRFSGFLFSGRIRPRINNTIRTGASVTDSPVAKSMAKVFV